MATDLCDWPRPYFSEPGGKPFLFYVVFGSFPQRPVVDPDRYRTRGLYPGLGLQHYDRTSHPEVFENFRQGYLWDQLTRLRPKLAHTVQVADECLILMGELSDQPDLNYLRDTVGLLTFFLDHGGVILYDPQMFNWWEPTQWRELAFQPGNAMPRHHVVILTSEEPEDASTTWFHTRGLRKFGRPDLSVHRVSPEHQEAVIDLFGRFIEFQAFGGIIEEGKEIRMATLPAGMTCHHAGDLEDFNFNNVHVEISPPA